MGGRHWTQEELDKLEDLISIYPVATIAKKLNRSFNSVNLKLHRMGLDGFAKSTDLLTMNQVCLMLGVAWRTVNRWKSKGLRIRRKGKFLVVKQQDLIKYLKEHPEEWNAANIPDDSLIMGFDWYKEKKKQDTKTTYNWTQDEVLRLKLLRRQGYSMREIAEKMGRSESSVKCKFYRRK